MTTDEIKAIEDERDAAKTSLAEATEKLTTADKTVKALEGERDAAVESAKTLRSDVETDVAWLAQQLKFDVELAAIAGESGLAGLSAEKLLELKESWQQKYEATLPARMQSKHTVEDPEATPDSSDTETDPSPHAARAAQM